MIPVVVRLHDHWKLREPDPQAVGLALAMGWTKHQVGADPRRYDIPATTVVARLTIRAVLERIYVQTAEGWPKPKILYVDVFGTSVEARATPVQERLTP